MINMVWAQANGRVLAKNGGIPWYLPADLAFFKAQTIGHPIVMGRNTFLSFKGRPLPQRRNIILTHDHDFKAPVDFEIMYSVAEVLAETVEKGDDLSVIGGRPIFDSFMSVADELVVTEIDADIEGDVFMPEIDTNTWQLVSSKVGVLDEKNKLPHVFNIYKRAAKISATEIMAD
ncbi:dihydrofolate reductase [Weissella beninensis]|uniref:Dihydrofolate reductase n=1 Tax=Periweissella beninensis TaxID=504936 RepID=A0ABT0VIZ6_9LACO|nr:dihydrofolate reductase [Periweissella beninensis]MBM7544299.1 dihydrofolate reductase [Periweissella beninensis]MCM2437801.1 dihydrofolate reductase [Periweissella beninensis]